MMSERLHRRQFLRSAAVAGASAAFTLKGAQAQDAAGSRVVLRRLGRTEFMTSHVVAAWDWNEWIYGEAVAAGINYWHKIAGWAAIPEPLQKLDREAWYCDIAIDSFEEEGAYMQFEWARTSLGLEYIDAMKLHSLFGRPDQIRAKAGYMKAFDRLKKEGKVRHLAGAQHGGDVAAICVEMIETGWFDHIQPSLSINPNADMLAMLELAGKNDIGVIAKKVMGALAMAERDDAIRRRIEEHLGPDGKKGAAVIKAILALPGVTAVTPRTENYQQLVDNLSTDGIEPTAREQAAVDVLREFARAEQCSYCGQCLATCPKGLPISDLLRYATYATAYGSPDHARGLYGRVPDDLRAESCADCGACERSCPQGMAVRRKLRQAHSLLG